MILWLASYPRSGNTLLRLILKSAFGRGTVSAHADDAADIGTDPAVAAAVGHAALGDPWPDALERMRSADELFLVKTHDPPPDAGPAVYVVRDGRAACRSFHHYLHDFSRDPATVADVVMGVTPFGSWGEHLDRWDPLDRPDTLLLRYELLVVDPAPQIERLAAFAGLTPTADWHNDFDRLHQLAPRFFRAGPANDPATALSDADAALFWAEHGDWMRRLGYGDGPPAGPAARRAAFAGRGRSIATLRAAAANAAAQLAEHRAAVTIQQAHADGRMMENRALFAEQVTTATATIDRLSSDRAHLRRQLREARRDALLGRQRIAQYDRLAGQCDALRGQRVELQQRLEQTQRVAYLSQKQYAASLQEQHRVADVLAAAVGELSKRQRLLLSSRFLRLGWALGFGSTPYWAEAGRDELTPLLDALHSAPPGTRGVTADVLHRLTQLATGQPSASGDMDRALRHLHAKGFRPSTVLDVGAAKGYWSVVASGVWPAAEYFMVDPLPQSEPALRELCDRDPRFRYLLVAVGAEPGETQINVPPDPDSSSLLGDPDPDPARRQTVEIETLDRLIAAGRVAPPQLVKLDVQGFELNVLAGGAALFASAEVFIVECNLFEFMPGCPRLHEIVGHMAGRGFYPFDLAGTLRRPFQDDLGQVDVVFVRGSSVMVAKTQWVDDPPAELAPSPGTPGEGGGEGLRSPNRSPFDDPHPNPLPAYRERGPELSTPASEVLRRPGSPPPSVSVIICTRDPRPDVFDRVLASIDAQTLPGFELLIVDNGSTPPLQLDGRHVIVEPEPGLSAARCAGIAAATGELLVFVDDDNFLAPDYLARAQQVAVAEPRVGLFGGIAEAELEVEIPRWKRRVLPYLGVRDHGPEPITAYADYWGEWEPIGAGMVARREVAERFVRMHRESADARQLGRSGAALLSGEDTLFARAAHRAGFACSYQPSLRLTHFMKGSRLGVRYLARLLAGHGRSYVLLHRALGKPVEDLKVRTAVARLAYRLRTAGRAGFVTWFWDLGYAAERRRDRRAR
jgi:FkbM family methyltransferase